MTREIVRKVSATGTVKTVYDRVSLSMEFCEKGKTTSEAKEAAMPTLARIKEVLAQMEEDGIEISKGTLVVTPDFPKAYRREGHTQVFDGYLAKYDIRFTSPNVDRAAEIMDRLTALEVVEVDPPVCFVSNHEQYYKEAFNQAFEKAVAKFNFECETVLGEGVHRDFEVISWHEEQPRTHQRRGKSLALAEATNSLPSGGAVTVETGDAEIKVTVILNYARKATGVLG